MIDGKLTYKVKVDESMWNVDRESSTLCINLEKVKELMWKSVVEGEREIDLTKVCVCVCVCPHNSVDRRELFLEGNYSQWFCLYLRWTTREISVSLTRKLRQPFREPPTTTV